MLKYLVKILFFTILLKKTNGFIYNPVITNKVIYISNTKNRYINYSKNYDVNYNRFFIKKPLLKQNLRNVVINMNKNMCPFYLQKISQILTPDQNENLVKHISGLFPKMDVISHFVLHSNDVLINYILNDIHLNNETKKSLVLFLIKFTQFGDSSGSQILELYHKIVECLI